jgi:hypothetical protein
MRWNFDGQHSGPLAVNCYGCVRCQRWHYEGESDGLYREHIMAQSKHGIRRQIPPPGVQVVLEKPVDLTAIKRV